MASPKRPAHRPQKEIDWKFVEEHLIAGAPSTKIAEALGICPDTLYRRCEEEHNMTYSAYSQQKRSNGDIILQKAQFDKAIGRTEVGDNTLLIWLGKTRLEQRESIALQVAPELEQKFDKTMDQIAYFQKNRHNPQQEKQTTEDEANEH